VPLQVAVAEATLAQVGDYLWLYGGSDASGPVGAVQRGFLDVEPTPATPAPNATPAPLKVLQWGVNDSANLPAARTGAAGFAANGTLYVVGGADAAGPRPELYWTVPTGAGELAGWKHLDETDLPAGLEGASAIVSGSNVIVIGGTTADGALASSIRANLRRRDRPAARLPRGGRCGDCELRDPAARRMGLGPSERDPRLGRAPAGSPPRARSLTDGPRRFARSTTPSGIEKRASLGST
jgi:hypothetical protein